MDHLLRKCPLCGGEAKVKILSHGIDYSNNAISNLYVVQCTKCKLTTRSCESYIWQDDNGRIQDERNGAREAVDLWNKRVQTEGGQDGR